MFSIYRNYTNVIPRVLGLSPVQNYTKYIKLCDFLRSIEIFSGTRQFNPGLRRTI